MHFNLNIIKHNLTAKTWIAERIFIRFSSSGSIEDSNDYGLAISQKIVDLNNWRIVYFFTNYLSV
jgi:hypothetical protein